MIRKPTLKEFRIVLIKPSKYDDEGYVIRFWKGALPSNTLHVLYGLTEDVKKRRVFGDLRIEIATFDETAEKVPVKKIIRWSRRPATKLVVGLVGVQTNQFPRALDLARQFRAAGMDVIVGGFHTSGTLAMLGEQEPDIQELLKEGICVVSGEVEDQWEKILSDALRAQLQPIYNFAQDLRNLVDIERAPLPLTSPRTMKRFVNPTFATVDTSRGCPFACTFCTVINVQGRKMRERSPESITGLMRRNYLNHGMDFYFLTDDNFARKKLWRETFEAIIRLREEGVRVSFSMQVDLARKPKDFVRLAGEAGCTQVFIGMESVNPENLKAEGKNQNDVEAYREIVREWHDAGVVVHAGYIIGLPWDSREQVKKDIQYLMDVIEPDLASFFMLTPLPGSQDHREMRRRGEWMDPDFNKRDSFHAAINHPRMTTEEWVQAYREAWETFYSKESIVKILSRWAHDAKTYWNLMWMLFWYKTAALIERQHPMIAGFFRLKDRLSRRPGFPIDPLPIHLWKRTKELIRFSISLTQLTKELEEVWLRTREYSERENRWLEEIQKIHREIWQCLKIADWQKTYHAVKENLPLDARAFLEPFEKLCSKTLLTRRDLKTFVKKWKNLRAETQQLRFYLAQTEEAARRSLDELWRIHERITPGIWMDKWEEAFSRLKQNRPSRFHAAYVKFDARQNRASYSRQDLQRFWAALVENLRHRRLWDIYPWKAARALVQDFLLSLSFARAFKNSYRNE